MPPGTFPRNKLLLFALLDELGPFYAIFTLWFADHGLTVGQISIVFILWALISMLCEVPGGALADHVDRRLILAGGLLMRAVGITTVLLFPSFAGVMVGAAIWAVHTSLSSGTWEALVYDQLQAHDRQDDYTITMARLGQSTHLGTIIGSLSATAILGLTDVTLASLGWITIALHVISLWAILTLPHVVISDDAASQEEDDDELEITSCAEWWATIKMGARAAFVPGVLRQVAVICMLLEGIFILDEYVPLLARERGASDALVPWFVLSTWAGLILGGELAARRPGLDGRQLGGVLGLSALAIIGALWSSVVWALGLIAIAYGAMNATWIITEARLQKLAPQAVRATVRSVVAFVAGLINMAMFGVIGLLSVGDDPTRGLFTTVAVLCVLGILLKSTHVHHASSS